MSIQQPITSATQVLRSDRAATGELWERAVFWTLVAGLAWVPFWLGGNARIAWGVNAVIFPLLAIVYETFVIVRGKSHPFALKQITLPAMLFFATVGWVFLQNETWVPKSLQHPIWSMTAEILDNSVAGSISVDRDLTALALMRLVTAGSVFWLALQLCRDGKRANDLLRAIAVICVLYTVYGFIAFALTPGYTLWYENVPSKGYINSTFYNRNTFGTFAGIGLVLMCAITLQHYRAQAAIAGVPFKYKLASLIETTGTSGASLLAGFIVVLVGLLMTASRGAIGSTVFALFIFGALTGHSRSGGKEQRLTIAIGTLLVATTFIAFGDEFLDRIGGNGILDAGRLSVAKMTINSALNSPILGFGYGTFVDIFPMFRDRSVSLTNHWEMAHNSYVEVFQGLGLLFGAMLVASVVLLVLKCLNGATTRHAGLTVPRVAVCVSLLVGVHALVDFSLQIQAIALIFMALLGAGVAQSESSRKVTAD